MGVLGDQTAVMPWQAGEAAWGRGERHDKDPPKSPPLCVLGMGEAMQCAPLPAPGPVGRWERAGGGGGGSGE